MPYNAGAAIGAGLVATAVMTAVLYMGMAMAPRQMPMNILYMMGSMMTRNRGMAYLMGAMFHFGVGAVLGLVHASVYSGLGIQSGVVGWGLLFGFVHWLIAGTAMGMMGVMHPLMRSGEMAIPGPFVKNYPMMTTVGFLMLHLVYGLVVGLLYQAWA